MSNVVDTIRQQHQRLLELVDQVPGEDVTADAQQFLGQIGEAGAEVRAPRQRSQLRALMRFWGSFIYDWTGEFPIVQLLPVAAEHEQAEEEPEGPVKVIGTYEIIEEIGHGGFSRVYKAFDTASERIVALKVLQDEQFARSRFRQQFVEHEQLVQGLDHPHIIPVYDVGVHKGIPYIAMHLVESGSVADRLSEWYWRPTVREILEIAYQAAEGLEYLHEQQIVHRDIKAANLLLTSDNHVYLTDFGIAQVMESAFRGIIVGTPAYMAPEAVRHPETVDGRVDLYSLGVVLFELLTGERPFEADSPEELMYLQVNEVPPEAGQIADLPESVSRLVDRCLAKDPDERQQGAAELKAEIKQLLASLSQEALSAEPAAFVSPPEAREPRPVTQTASAPAPPAPPTGPVAVPPPGYPVALPPTPTSPYSTDVRTKILYTKPPLIAWLSIITGPRIGKDFRVGSRTRIGRDPSLSDMILDDEGVSREHAEVRLKDHGFYLSDLGSVNGTFVNDRSVTQRIRLLDGDVVRIGETELVFKLVDVPSKSSPDQRRRESILGILIVISGPRMNDYYIVGRERSAIGRSHHCDMVIYDEAVSAQHALLVYDKLDDKQGIFTLYDLASPSGTVVNEEPIVKRRLKHNDVITIGKTEMVFKRLDR